MTKKTKLIRALWFVNTPSLAAGYFGIEAMHSGSWIEAAELELDKHKELEFAVVFLSKEKTQKIIYKGRTYYIINQKDSPNKLSSWKNRISHKVDEYKFKDFLSAIEDYRPDIIHVYGSEGPFGKLANKTKVPLVLQAQGFTKICEMVWRANISLPEMLLNSNLLKLINGSGLFHEYLSFKKIAKREVEILKNIKNFIGNDDWDTAYARWFASWAKVFRLNPIARQIFFKNCWRVRKRSQKRIVILSILSGAPYKGLDQAFKVAKVLRAKHINFQWRVAGCNPKSEVIKFYEKKFGAKFADSNFKFLGIVGEREIVSEFLKASVYVHPSHIENFCTSIIEAKILGLPIVANMVGGTADLIGHGRTGFLIADNDYITMASKIGELASDWRLAQTIGSNARTSALDNFNSAKTADKLISIYKDILGI